MSVLSLSRRDVAAIRERDPAARSTADILLCYPGLHALIAHRVANRLWRWKLTLPARLVSYVARAVTGIDIHPGASIGPGLFIDHGAGVVIGETAELGENVTLYHGVTLGGVSWSPGKRHPTVGDNVVIGAGAKVLGPLNLGPSARVGANSVVIEDVPPHATVIGIPARIVQTDRKPGTDPFRINLDHHLMPDPVGRALAQLADRIAFLEVRQTARQASRMNSPMPVEDPRKRKPANCNH